MSFLRRAAAVALTAFGVFLAVFGTVELVLRVFRGAPAPWELPQNFDYAYLDARRPFFRETRDKNGVAVFVSARSGAHDESFVMPKPPGTTRVFVVGGSVAMPYSGSDLLDKSFARLLPGARIEAIGCGMGGYDSARELAVLREVLRYQPDFVIVMSGNNEYFGPPISHPRLVKLMYKASHLAVFRALVGSPRPSQDPSPAERERAFEANLREMALLAHQAGATIAFCALPANLRDSVPTTGASLPWDQPDFFSAWTAWEEGDAARAVRLFAARVASVPGDPHAHYWLARSLDMVGRGREAALSYARAVDLDRPGERTSPARAGIVRRVARESDAILIDLAAAFSVRSPLGTTGGTLMRDACHWRRAYDPWVADLIAAAVARDPRASATARMGETPEGEWRDLIHSGLIKACYAPADLFHEEALTLIRRARREDPARFARMVSSARALSETVYRDHPEGDCAQRQEPLWSHISEAMRREGRPREAEQAAARALAASPGFYRARLAAALSAGGAGRANEAAARLEELRARRPDRHESRLWAGYWRAKAAPARAGRVAR